MEKENHPYNKSDGYRELEPERAKKTPAPPIRNIEIEKKILPGYFKPEGTIDIPTYIVIFSGGEGRERSYFSLIERNKAKFQRIKLEFLDKSLMPIDNENNKLAIKAREGGFSPDKLWLFAKHWLNERYIQKHGEVIDPIDSLYLISDVDHFISELLRIKPLCEAAKIKLIISNSCFEKWLYYGYFAEKPHENTTLAFSCPDEVIKISSAFKTYCGTVIKGGIKTNKAIFLLKTAISNAKANYAKDENGIPVLYATDMFILGEELLPLIMPELEKVNQKNQEIATDFRNKNFSN